MQKTISALRSALCLYEPREAQSIIDLLLDEVCNISRIDRIMHPDSVLPDDQRQRLLDCAAMLSQGIPVQQALGYEWFCGQRFKVTSDVLIPRPETAELVQWICDDVRLSCDSVKPFCDSVKPSCDSEKYSCDNEKSSVNEQINILDIGTGTGCIAISLARLINNSQVLGVDLSTAALNVARENSFQQSVDNVYFANCDILKSVDNDYFNTQINQELTSYQPTCEKNNPQELFCGYQQENRVFNIIVSNPPYICQQEKKDMSAVVLDHEPAMALFVPDDDPLLFYRTIAQFGLSHLSEKGKLYFEINAAYGAETCQMLREMGYEEVTLRQDINGRDRMVRAVYRTGLASST